jgi:hypothetical protein
MVSGLKSGDVVAKGGHSVGNSQESTCWEQRVG